MRIVGIDLGARRIGLALSDPSATLARPWRTLTCEGSLQEAIARVASEISALRRDEDGLARIVVGLPKRLNGSANEQTTRVLEFADRLRKEVGLPVDLQDERLSSREAETRLAVRERDWRKRKTRLDAAAAAVILQDYLDGRQGRRKPNAAEG